MIAIDTMCCIK